MKQTIFILLIIALTAFSSCRKHTDTGPSTGGSWTIKGTTYNPDSCVATVAAPYAELVAQTPINSGTISTYSQFVIGFGAVPLGASSYNFISDSALNNGVDSIQAYMSVSIGGLTNTSIYQSTANGSVAVTVSSTGKITASGTNILVQNSLPPYDTTRVTFNVTQTN